METYPSAAVEQAMKVQEVIMRAMANESPNGVKLVSKSVVCVLRVPLSLELLAQTSVRANACAGNRQRARRVSA